MTVIYGLVEVGSAEIRYVGRTCRPLDVRLSQHFHKARSECEWLVYRWIRSAAYSVEIVVLESDPTDIREAERRWIDTLRSRGDRLTNVNPGGDGAPPGFRLTPEQRAKISEANRIRPISAETRARQSASHRGFQHTSAAREKMSVARRGKSKSPETRERMAAAQHARSSLSPTQVREIRRRYESGRVRQKDLADEFGVQQTTISRIVRGQTWTIG